LLQIRSSAYRRELSEHALPQLVETIQQDDEPDLQLMALHIVMNISTEGPLKLSVCKLALDTLVMMCREQITLPIITEFAYGVLTNISKNPACKKMMYRVKLTAERELFGASVGRWNAVPELSVDGAKPAMPLPVSENQRRFEGWYSKCFDGLNPSEANEKLPGVTTTTTAVAHGGKQRPRSASASLCAASSAASYYPCDTSIGAATMAETAHELSLLRRSLRQPINSLWSPARQSPTASFSSSASASTLPRTWSHRVGPPGILGSVTNEFGENRWDPPLKEVRPDVFRGRPEQSSATCVLEPGGARNELSFHHSDQRSGTRVNPVVSLVRFKYVQGSKIGEMFPSFQINGEWFHLYHASRVSSEMLDPGDCPVPLAPDSTLGGHRALQPPQHKKPVIPHSLLPPMPLPPASPPIHRHYMPGLQAIAALSHIEYGHLPASAICFMVEQVAPEPEPESEEEEEEEEPPPYVWTIDDSIWAPRKFKEHPKSYFNTQRVNRLCLEIDWKRLKACHRNMLLLNKICREDEEKERQIKQALLAGYDDLMAALDYYSVVGGGNQPFAM
jgi:hypothetical protein